MQEYLQLMEENVFVMVIAIIGIMGCTAYSLAGKGINILYEESLLMTSTNNPFIKQLKLRRENGMRINVNISNTYAFIAKNMDKYKYLNMSIRDYVKMAWLVQLLCIMIGLIGGILRMNMWFVLYGIICAMAVNCVGKIEDVDRKEAQVIINMVDYFDNILAMDKKMVESQGDQAYNVDNASREADLQERIPAARPQTVAPAISFAGEMNTMSLEQKKLVEEVLREYLT